MGVKKRAVLVPAQAAKPIGPYSLGIRVQDLVFTSGAIGMEPQSGALVDGGIAAETRQALENLRNVLEAGGSSLENVVKTTVFMVDLGQFAAMNEVYAEFFAQDPPARSTVQVAALPGGASIEIEAIAAAYM